MDDVNTEICKYEISTVVPMFLKVPLYSMIII